MLEAKAESSKVTGRERTNSSGETVETGQLKWKRECGNVTYPICDTGCNGFWRWLGRRTRDQSSRQGSSIFGKRISMLISRDTSMAGDPLEI